MKAWKESEQSGSDAELFSFSFQSFNLQCKLSKFHKLQCKLSKFFHDWSLNFLNFIKNNPCMHICACKIFLHFQLGKSFCEIQLCTKSPPFLGCNVANVCLAKQRSKKRLIDIRQKFIINFGLQLKLIAIWVIIA